MKGKIDYARFDRIVDRAKSFNAKSKITRFIPIRSKDGNIKVFGMYDYVKKRHIVSVAFEDVNKIFGEIEDMLSTAEDTVVSR